MSLQMFMSCPYMSHGEKALQVNVQKYLIPGFFKYTDASFTSIEEALVQIHYIKAVGRSL